MRTNFDLSGFRRSTIGFDRLFDLLESSAAAQNADGYPPFDLEYDDADSYRITLAVAGFKPQEIEVTAQQNLLIVSGRKADDEQNDGRYLHRGIARRGFERRFELADFVQVKSADMKDGLLTIDLAREVPEAMRPRRIEIGGNVHQLETGANDGDAKKGSREAA
ncbi:Hsp20 family protein [Enterovirga sp. GCM10030262]|uniref:Hsp20 family protein n=1 Tax=Enterovirga sp. GCM10030262 TaxID=3273391 RepID=UPI0036110C47